MNILYLHQYFTTPLQAGGGRSYWISLQLIENGHQVTLVTSRNIQNKFIENEVIDGIKVIYIRNQYSNEFSILRRIFSFVSFMIASSVVTFKQKKPDILIATSTPLTIGFPALLMSFLKRIPYIFEVRDLWPEFPIQMGAIKSKSARKILESFEKIIYRKALHIIALSPGMKDGIVEAGIDPGRITIIPNMSKNDRFYPHRKNENIMRSFGISSDKFNLIHFGAIGPANGLEYLINAARILNSEKINDIQIILLGGGMIRKELEKEVEDCRLNTIVYFIDSQPMNITSEIVNCCDCSIICFKNLQVLQTNSPNKLFDSLAAGKPVIVNSAGWTKDLVEENQCGFFVDPEKPDDLVKAVLKFKNDKDLAILMGKNARSLAENKFDKSLLCRELVHVIEDKYMNYKG